jgi:phage shock protein A
MAIQGFQVWLQVPDLRFLIPDLSVERIERAAADAIQGGLFVAGLVNGGFTIADALNNRTLPALAHGATSVVCFSAYSIIGEFRTKIEQLETLASQMQVLTQNNQDLREQVTKLSTISNALENHSTVLDNFETQIGTILTESKQLTASQKEQIRSCLADAKNKLVTDVVKEIRKTLDDIKTGLERTSQNIEEQMKSLTLQHSEIAKERSRLESLLGIVPRILDVAESDRFYRNLSVDDQRRIFELRQFYNRTITPLNNQLGQPR